MSSPFFDLIYGVIKTVTPPRNTVVKEEPPQVPAHISKLLTETAKSFRANSDMLVISETALKEARSYDKEGWLETIASRTIILDDSLKNHAVVSGGYAGW